MGPRGLARARLALVTLGLAMNGSVAYAQMPPGKPYLGLEVYGGTGRDFYFGGEMGHGEAMTRQVVSCRPGDDLGYVEGLMIKNHKSRVLIRDEKGRPVGVISLSDIAQHDRVYAAETIRQVSSREIRPA